MILPRPDLSSSLGIKYRRIPLLSIGRDVYLDTRLVLSKLESLPIDQPKLSAASGTDDLALERLLSHYSIDGGLFTRAAQLLFSLDNPLLKDPKFLADRAEFATGAAPSAAAAAKAFSKEDMAALGPEALADLRDYCQLLEETVLADGREWILKGNDKGPGMADIEAVFVLYWVMSLPGALPKGLFGEERFPRVWKWVERFRVAVGESTASASAEKKGESRVTTVKGDKASEMILGAEWNEKDVEEKGVDAREAIVQFHKLGKGTVVEVWPTDSGSALAHRDVGRLVRLDAREVVIENEKGVRIHAPRHGFRVKPSAQAVASSL